ncbi:hypothetical protein PhaeoP83_00702 [Phaeobacter inhibens]|uniref:Uncharacterized protein n=1 Tax=Phaeobacter inhibens TaxID=221822 RepID=A0ABM6RAX1_9RHOB|nr:hypothetical protein [Phaeobacter inhibens]AUQ49010.1 hypothetical protein PhaeoP83_00702 [Phaeobacter inhibens]AUQ93510.1 hypothetical protein PhaeoP66_00695 [Phaeobacter inhibens]AUR18813.1 hypothetical protein PhaeoP80_00702 [Phaeobacter inhibens]
MLSFSLNTFVKICLRDTGGRISEIQKKLEGSGGYDFYNSFHRAMRARLSGKQTEQAQEIILNLANETERKRNLEAFSQVDKKFGSARTIEGLDVKRSITFDGYGIEIFVDPLFRVERSGVLKAYAVWLPLQPELSRKYAAVACLIMREAYRGTSLANMQFHYYDSNKDRTYSEKQINNNTSLIPKSDVSSISKLAKEV